VPQDGLEDVDIDVASGKRSDPACKGVRVLPFAAGYAPTEEVHCPLDQLREFFGGDDR